MKNSKPIKRHKALQSFSKEHHYGLLLSWKIQQALRNGTSESSIWKYVNWFWENHLSTHFDIEEKLLFPILSSDNELIKKAVSQHKRLRKLFTSFPKDSRTLNFIDEELEQHIRFEERYLFNEIQQIATEEELENIKQFHNFEFSDKCQEEFWKG